MVGCGMGSRSYVSDLLKDAFESRILLLCRNSMFYHCCCGGYDDNKNKTPLINYDAHDGVIGALQSSCSEKSYKIQSNTSAMVRFLI